MITNRPTQTAMARDAREAGNGLERPLAACMLRLLRQRLRCRWRRIPHARLQRWLYPSLTRLLEKLRDTPLVPAVEYVRERRLPLLSQLPHSPSP